MTVIEFSKKLFPWRSRRGANVTDVADTSDKRPGPASDRGADDAPPLLVFDHIPKTAGTTFRRSYLVAALPRDERWILSGGEKNAEDLERFLQLPDKRRRRIRIVAGHYADALRHHVPDARFVTVVRDPVDRIVSSYLHALFHPDGEALWPDVRRGQMGLREFALKYERPNAQSAQLLGRDGLDDEGIRRGLNARYALVGYTEAFDEFVFLLHVREGFPLCLYNNRLVRQERRTFTPPEEDLSFLRDANRDDLRLHQVVRSGFRQAVDNLPPSLQAMMARYLDALEQFRTASGGDPTRSIRLDESVRDEDAVRSFELVFGRPPHGGPA